MHIEKKSVGLNPQSQIHYIDHLAPVCILMDIPLVFIDERDQSIAIRYYPGLKTEFIPYEELTREFLITHYDVLFMSDLWDRKDFHESYADLESSHGKILRHVHCPHGFSDKGFYLKKCANEDICLVYGQNMIDLLKIEKVLEDLHHYVVTGNYRFTYFKKHREFFDQVYEKEIESRFEKKQFTILYAPTWLDLEESTTFFDAYNYLIDNLPKSFNMIVKLHPRLELDDNAMYYHITGKYEKQPNVLFLKDFPLVHPLLAHVDAYIGDMSSIGYDFLAFNKPMFFLNKQKRNARTDRGLYLFRCGIEIRPDAYPLLYQMIDANLGNDASRFTNIRSEVYEYTFGPEKPFEEIKKEIMHCYNTTYM
jgi:hypothetical protein